MLQVFLKIENLILFDNSNEIKSPEIDKEYGALVVYLQKETDIYQREFLGIVLSTIFYFSIFKILLKKSRFKRFLFVPFLGMFVLLLHAITGFPQNNFDPLVGDTFKTFYYSFFLCIAFCFLIIELNVRKVIFYLLIIFQIFLFLFSIGFPKDYTNEFSNELMSINSFSTFCEINKFLILNKTSPDDDLDCKIQKQVKGYNERHANIYPNQSIKLEVFNTILLVLVILVIINQLMESTLKKLRNELFLSKIKNNKNE